MKACASPRAIVDDPAESMLQVGGQQCPPAPQTGTDAETIVTFPLAQLKPSPENAIYRPILETDPETIELRRQIAEYGQQEPIVVTEDRFILSGHRRAVALRSLGHTTCRVRLVPWKREDDLDRHAKLLVAFNCQRHKNYAEILRETVVTASEDDVYRHLTEYRRQLSDKSRSSGLDAGLVVLGTRKTRSAISPAKRQFLAAINRVLEQLRPFWPVSIRQLHYGLLNNPPLRHSKRPASRYANDLRSYKDLCDIALRARLTGEIAWDSVIDETRKVLVWATHDCVAPFLRQETDRFLQGYWRNLQQSQPHHIEIIAEKNTLLSIVRPVAEEFCIPLTTGRGHCSGPPRNAMLKRYRSSGREKLILLILSDLDPDGMVICDSFAQSMRDDFGIKNVEARKVAIRPDQVEKYGLPRGMHAKKTSAHYTRFVERFGKWAYELEALDGKNLQEILRDEIRNVLDIDAFNRELDAERSDAMQLEKTRAHVRGILADAVQDIGEATS